MFNFDHPFFKPLWKRIATAFVCFAWGFVEYNNDATLWAYFFWALAAFVSYHFFIKKSAAD